MGVEQQTPSPIQTTAQTPAELPPEMQELLTLLGNLFQKASELGLSCIEMSEDLISKYPDLKDLRDACLDVTRIIRRIVKLSKKVQR